MKVAIISQDPKDAEMKKLEEAFKESKIEPIFIPIEKVAMFTKGTKTQISYDDYILDDIEGAYLKASADFTEFTEPLLDELVAQGVYTNLKPESYFITSNRPFQLTVLNEKQVKIPKTTIVSETSLIESVAQDYQFPIIFKTFQGRNKTQSLIVESSRSLMTIAKSIKQETEMLSIQEYLEGDLVYVGIIGKKVFGMKRKWNEKKEEHEKKYFPTTLTEQEEKNAIRAGCMLGVDIGIVKMIKGKVIGVRTNFEFELISKITSKDTYKAVVKHFEETIR